MTIEQGRTAAVVQRSRWPGWIWALPVLAAGILFWLGLRFFITHGVPVTVLFDRAPDVSAQNTRVLYRGVQVGRVSSVALSDDGTHVRVALSMQRSAEKYLRSGTRFWLQGLSTDLTDLPSLMSAISGPSIVMEPGPGRPQREFTGLAAPPAFPEPVAGTPFVLLSGARGSAKRGSRLYYLGLEVGKVLDVRLLPPRRFRIEVLVRAPYDRLVHPGSRFWDAGALQLSFSGGLKLQLLSAAALVQGAIAFDTPGAAAAQPAAAADTTFTLYPDRASAQRAPSGPYALYSVCFAGAAGQLEVGAPVKLRDFVIGEVRNVGFEFDTRSGRLRTPVTIELDADRLHFTGIDAGSGSGGGTAIPIAGGTGAGTARVTDWTALLDRAVSGLVAQGLRARLAQDPPLLGTTYVALDFVPHAPAAALDTAIVPPRIPATEGGGLSALAVRLGELPVAQIGDNVRQISARVRALVSSPRVDDSLRHLDVTLAGIDQIVQSARPQVQPLIASLRRAAGQMEDVATDAHQVIGGPDEQGGLDQAVAELTRSARSVRALADYLQQHPEALLRGKRP